MPEKASKCYIRKNPNTGIYKSKVGVGDKAKTVFIKDREVFKTNDPAVIKFLDVDPGVVLNAGKLSHLAIIAREKLKAEMGKEFDEITDDELTHMLEAVGTECKGWDRNRMIEFLKKGKEHTVSDAEADQNKGNEKKNGEDDRERKSDQDKQGDDQGEDEPENN